MKCSYQIQGNERVEFKNQVSFCVGTGRLGLALQQEYQAQLRLVQEKIGFRYIRGHGLFSDDMAIFHTYKDKDGTIRDEYNFTYLDRVMDFYRSVNIRPFLELGFMPYKLASGTETVFYWKGNITPPADYDRWCALVQATLRHLIERYGEEEVLTWPIEIWNEPNLTNFWKNADMEEYFKLYEKTAYAIKQVNNSFRVGGPAICGVKDEYWMNEFLKFCKKSGVPIDFITRHHYTSEQPEIRGHYGYAEMRVLEDTMHELQVTRDIVDSFTEFKDMEIHITEFSTSYIPDCPIHDTNYNAAYVAGMLSLFGDCNESYSYWTFGDVFEERGVKFTPFHGGFGMVANGCIPKPTFWTFEFFKRLEGQCVLRTKEVIVMKRENGSYVGVAWNRRDEELALELELGELPIGQVSLLMKTVDEDTCNPRKVWHDMGEPANPTEDEYELLRMTANPEIRSALLHCEEGDISFALLLMANSVVYFEANPIEMTSDRGFTYEEYIRR